MNWLLIVPILLVMVVLHELGRILAARACGVRVPEFGVFEMRHLKLRSPAGLPLAEASALFAAKLVRFATGWLADSGTASQPPFVPGERPVSVKQTVRTVANTPAWVICQPSRGADAYPMVGWLARQVVW